MMRSGGPIAFYEIAATLIPLLLFGGVVLDSLHPPKLKQGNPADTDQAGPARDRREPKDKDDSPKARWTVILVVNYLPVVAVVVIVAEVVALDAVVTGSVDSFHAKFVGLTLILGMAAVVLAVWVPWVVEASDGSRPKTVLFVVTAVAVVAALWLQPLFSNPVGHLADAVAKQPHPEHAGMTIPNRERIWLEHLIATSDYRIDKLEAEAEASDTGTERVTTRLRTQEDVLAEECAALGALIAGSEEEVDPLEACSG